MDGATKNSACGNDVSEVGSTPRSLGGVPTLRDLSLISVPSWYLLGLQLGVSGDELDVIERNYSRDNHMCKVKMFGTWLRVDTSPTYVKLARAFVAVGNRTIAEAVCAGRGIPLTILDDSPVAAVNNRMVEAVDYHTSGASTTPSRKAPKRHQAEDLSPPLSTISNHHSPPPPSLQPTVVHGVTSSPLHSAVSAHLQLSKAADFAHENRQMITAKFADFQTKVCNKLLQKGINTKEFRLFVTNQFPPGDCIPPPPAGLTEIFEAITHHGLWDYFHYSPLVQIAKKFGADDPEMEGWVRTYKQDLKAYSLVITVEEYIETDLEIAGAPSPKRAKYDPHYYTPVEWKTKFVDHSLQYLAEVWELFSYHYLVPDCPPTALLDRIRRGCFSVTWLVPSGLIPLLYKQVKINAGFFQQYRIVKVTVGNEVVYKEVTKESTLEAELAQQKKAPLTNTPQGAEGGAKPHRRPQQETFGGYDCKFVEPPPSVFQTECPICSLILRDPYLTSCCGTHFCYTCSERLQAEHKHCPTCREENFELYLNKSLRRSLNQLHVLCTHSEDGCEWTGELGKLEHHLREVTHSTEAVVRFHYEKEHDDQLSLEVGDVITDVKQGESAEHKDYTESGKSFLKFVVLGKAGVGKSSIVNGLLGKYLAKEAQSLTDITTEINEYKLTIEVTGKSINKSVEVAIIDFPGLANPEEANLTEISKHCADADLLIYCLDMRGRMTADDRTKIKELTQRVGPDVWKNAMFVLTFANQLHFKPKPRGLLQKLTFGYSVKSERREMFKSLLTLWEEAVVEYLGDKLKLPKEITSGICIVPAGYGKFSPPDRTDWLSELWFTALSKCKKAAQPALIGINYHHFKVTASGNRTLTLKSEAIV